MTTKRNSGLTRTTLPDNPSSGMTSSWERTLARDGERALPVTVPDLPAAARASGPAACRLTQPDSNPANRATRTNRIDAVKKFETTTSTGEPGTYLFHSRVFSRILSRRLSQSAQLCAHASPANSLRVLGRRSSTAFSSRWTLFFYPHFRYASRWHRRFSGN